MIAVTKIRDAENLPRLHGMFEHTLPHHDNTFVVHYSVEGHQHQDIYAGVVWQYVSDRVRPLLGVVDNGVDIVVINAQVIDFENYLPGYMEDEDGDLLI